MASSAARQRWSPRLVLALVIGLAAVVLSQAVRFGPDASGTFSLLVVQEPLTQADARLLASGWKAKPEWQPCLSNGSALAITWSASAPAQAQASAFVGTTINEVIKSLPL
jgi:hypothetical protein